MGHCLSQVKVKCQGRGLLGWVHLRRRDVSLGQVFDPLLIVSL